jgi:hypothetical protein
VYPESSTNRAHQGGNNHRPSQTPRAIFREEARQHYIQNQEKVELPEVVSPRSFAALWIVALLLMGAGLIIAFWPLISQW